MSDNQGLRPEDLPHVGQTPAQDAAAAETGAGAASAPQSEQPTLPLTPPTAPTVPASVAAQQAATQPVPPDDARHGHAHTLPPVYPAMVPHPDQPPYPGQAFGLPAGGAGDAGQPPQYRHDADGGGQKKSGGTRIAALLVAAAVVGGVAGLGGAWAGSNLWSTDSGNGVSSPQTVTVNDTSSVNNTTAIAAKVVPSVVTIDVSAGSSEGTGSGVVLSADGYILTNTHVVTLDGATASGAITVTTSTGHVYRATVVGTDPTYDLAVIKLKDASGLTPISWGDSGKLNVGDETVAVGAPLGLSNSVTTGIVSALNRSIEIASSAAPNGGSQDDGNGGQNGGSPFYFDFGQGQSQQQSATESIKIAVLQTDAAINPGNSGGALVDSDGKLIGINVAIASTGSSSTSQAGSIGVGFSIPSDIARRIAGDLIKDGKATHGLLGATVADAASVQGATTTGAYVEKVTAGGAAATAGLQKGDVITEFNGAPVSDSVDLTAQVRALAGGAKADLVYTRDGQSHTAQVTLGTFTA